jgi:hypothetical protein
MRSMYARVSRQVHAHPACPHWQCSLASQKWLDSSTAQVLHEVSAQCLPGAINTSGVLFLLHGKARARTGTWQVNTQLDVVTHSCMCGCWCCIAAGRRFLCRLLWSIYDATHKAICCQDLTRLSCRQASIALELVSQGCGFCDRNFSGVWWQDPVGARGCHAATILINSCHV